ncbi:MAG: ABC transporter ATP-binding protein/permease [Candidatus Aegiribacteria sp.]|nr:ABC transporter ATP-binding protein/permease [Candidatus Aegiribacteria sp.]
MMNPEQSGARKLEGKGHVKAEGKAINRTSGPAWPLLKRLAHYVKSNLGLFAVTVSAAAFAAIFELLPPFLIRAAIDRCVLGEEGNLIWLWAAGLLAVSLLQGGVDFLRLYLTALLGQKIVFRIRNDLFTHLNRLSFSFFDRARTGDLMSRVTSDTDVLSMFFGRAGIIVLTNALFLIGVMVVLFSWNWILGLVYAAMLPVIVVAIRIYARKVRPAMGRVRKTLGLLGSTLQETLAGIMVVKVFGRDKYEEKRFDRSSSKNLSAGVEAAKIQSLWMPFMNVFMGIGTGLILWVGGYGVIRGEISLGTLIAFITYISMLLRPVRQTGMMMNVVMRSMAASERIFEVMDTIPEIADSPGALPLPPIQGIVKFDNVSFSYDGNNPVLIDVSLKALPGELVAVVGPSGAGKSTLVHLIPRFYNAERGSLTLDGNDVREVTLDSLRRNVGIALQSVFLFDTSIRENIAYGSPGVSDREIERVARTAQIHDFIHSLPMGYGTPVGERGVRLSGGQRQRIALARVLLHNPRVLILDEPTSSVDAATERKLRDAFEVARKGRTTFVIAHRLGTVRHADRIIVLKNGRVEELGLPEAGKTAHEMLMDAGGLYSTLYSLQFTEAVEP